MNSSVDGQMGKVFGQSMRRTKRGKGWQMGGNRNGFGKERSSNPPALPSNKQL
jgi:hypothetical protein